jgi:hypothetical protein
MSEIAYTRTPAGQFLFDIAFRDLSDKWIARKHQVPIAEVRNVRKSPVIQKLRRSVEKDRGRR